MSSNSPHQTTSSSHDEAPYSLSALRSFAISRSLARAPSHADISSEHFLWCFDVHSNSNLQLKLPLHTHFCTTWQDRIFAYNEGLDDIWDVVCISFLSYYVALHRSNFALTSR